MIKLFYISTRDVRKNRADAVHIVLSCQAFAKYGVDVTLVAPTVSRSEVTSNTSDWFSAYGLEQPLFNLVELKTKISEIVSSQTKPLSIAFEKFRAHIGFALRNRKELSQEGVIVYSKCYISTVPYIVLRMIGVIKCKIAFETITPKKSLLHKFIYVFSDCLISHLKYITADIMKVAKVPRGKIVEVGYFTQSEEILKIEATKDQLRDELGFKENEKYILYAGKTGKKVKQVEYFIEAAEKLPNAKFLIVGANDEAKLFYEEVIQKKNLKNLFIHGFQPLTLYYKFVLASDVLVGFYPPSYHNKYHLSPGKSGIYFASKNPCIFSDLPSLRSLFPDDILYYATPDNIDSLVSVIKQVLDNPKKAKCVANRAYDFSRGSSYSDFAEEVLCCIDEVIK